jgi:hypothetical protein
VRRFILSITLVLGLMLAWMVFATLIARPAPDPTVYQRILDLPRNVQPDPSQPNRYQDLVVALTDFRATLDEFDQLARHEGAAQGITDIDYSSVANFTTVLPRTAPTHRSQEALALQDRFSRDAIQRMEQDGIFDRISEILTHPNLANEYPRGLDAEGNRLPIYYWELPEIANMRLFALAQAARIRLAEADGNLQHAADIFRDNAPLGLILTRQATLIEHLVGYAICEVLLIEAQFLAASPSLTTEAHASLQAGIAELHNLGDPTIAIEGERLGFLDVHNHTHTRSGRFIPSAYDELIGDLGMDNASVHRIDNRFLAKLADIRAYFMISKNRSLRVGDQYYNSIATAIRETDPARRADLLARSDHEVATLGARHGLARLTLPALSRFAQQWLTTQRSIRLTHTMIAMAEYRLDRAHWPTSLDQLVPDYLDAIPTDPLTSNPFEYNHEPGQPPSPERFRM